jgi:hypothetical protein
MAWIVVGLRILRLPVVHAQEHRRKTITARIVFLVLMAITSLL